MPRELFSSCLISTTARYRWHVPLFLLKVVLRRFRSRSLRGACEERISINAHDSAPARRIDATRPVFVSRYIIGERRNTVVYDFTFGVRCRCQCALRRHALTANHEWQVIAMVDTHNAEGLGTPAHAPVRFASRLRMGAWRDPYDVSELVAMARGVVGRRLPRHNYPRTVYLRPLFNLQLMFQIAINPRQ